MTTGPRAIARATAIAAITGYAERRGATDAINRDLEAALRNASPLARTVLAELVADQVLDALVEGGHVVVLPPPVIEPGETTAVAAGPVGAAGMVVHVEPGRVASVRGYQHRAEPNVVSVEEAARLGHVTIIDEAHQIPREDGRDAGFLPEHGERAP